MHALLEKGSGGCDVVRLLTSGVVLSAGMAIGIPHCMAADAWGGSIGVANDYIIRGISRSDEGPALQIDLHYLNDSGFVAGLFASNTKINPGEPKDVEVDAFVGFAWIRNDDWHGKILVSHYAYPWNHEGSGYNYDELSVDAVFREWLNLTLVYSPNAALYVPSRGLIGVSSESAELNLQRPVWRKLSADAGVGYSFYEGPNRAGYVYWSVGAAYDLAPLYLSLAYVDTTAGAKTLFYNDAVKGRWTAAVIWRF
jgi:uncharacterized protein (TIGR02001 family)